MKNRILRITSQKRFRHLGDSVGNFEGGESPLEEVEGFALFARAAAFGEAGRLDSGILWVAFFDDAIVSGDEGDFFCVGKGLEMGGTAVGDGIFGSEQAVDHGWGPGLIVLFVEEDEFAQQLGVAEAMGAVVFEVGFPLVVDGAALEGGQDSGVVHGLGTAFLVGVIPGEDFGADGVEPVEGAFRADAGFVEVGDGRVGDLLEDGSFDGREAGGAVGVEIGQRALAEGFAAVEVAQDFAGSLEGQELVLAQIDGGAFEAGAVLHGGGSLGREGGAVDATALAGLGFDLVLGDFELGLGEVVDLAALDAGGMDGVEGLAAGRAAIDAVGDGAVGVFDHAERVAGMPELTSGGTLAGRAQAFWGGLGESFRGGRLVAVVRVFGELSFEGVHALAQCPTLDAQGDVFRFEEGEVGCELIDPGGEFHKNAHDGFLAGAVNGLGFPACHAEQSSLRKRGVSGCRYTSLISTWIVVLRSLRVRPRVSPSRCQLAAR